MARQEKEEKEEKLCYHTSLQHGTVEDILHTLSGQHHSCLIVVVVFIYQHNGLLLLTSSYENISVNEYLLKSRGTLMSTAQL